MSVPAGWYDDGSGRQRWWDGSAWGVYAQDVSPPRWRFIPQVPVRRLLRSRDL